MPEWTRLPPIQVMASLCVVNQCLLWLEPILTYTQFGSYNTVTIDNKSALVYIMAGQLINLDHVFENVICTLASILFRHLCLEVITNFECRLLYPTSWYRDLIATPPLMRRRPDRHEAMEQTWIRKINRPWPNSNLFWRWLGYVSRSNFRPFLLCILQKMSGNTKFDPFH